ncbi:26S proteasome non-ATPase regulatory subunit 10-like [Culicoides brevitarsis]|uniref:26S proteasome non-ATPase regulatory subunit 10-like n=1 Tax=Culicoides brevitarsis TaxID=469753 RepID=UPI00307B81AC
MANEKIDLYALSQQDYYVLEEAVKENPKILTHKDSNDRLLHHWAALGGRDRLLEHLYSLSNAPDIDVEDDTKATPLILATLKGSLPCVKFLVSKGANVNAKNWQGHSPFQYACSKGHKDIVEFLLTAGADPNVRDDRNDVPLHRLASLGRTEIMKLLFDWKGKLDVNVQNKEGSTPLHLACEDEQIQCAMMLLEKGANVEIQNKEKKTPLDLCKPGLRRQIKTKLGIADE